METPKTNKNLLVEFKPEYDTIRTQGVSEYDCGNYA